MKIEITKLIFDANYTAARFIRQISSSLNYLQCEILLGLSVFWHSSSDSKNHCLKDNTF
jgi:hypothetical protein